MDFAVLCEKLESLELAQPSRKSFAAKNFAYLKSGLNLSQCETKFLIWSYCHEQSRPSPLPDIQFDSIADRNTFVALMLDEEESTVSHYFATRRLCSLRLLETSPMSSLDRTQAAGTLRSFLAGSDHFINLVELGHGNQEAILTHLLSAELDAFLDPELLPDEVLEVLSPPFRRLYEQGRSNTPLCAASLQVMVDWMLGVQLPLAELHPIQNLMSFEIAREALKLYAVRCCRQNFALRDVNVLRALRHAVSQHTAPSPWDIAIA